MSIDFSEIIDCSHSIRNGAYAFLKGVQACDVISVGGPRFVTKCDREGGVNFTLKLRYVDYGRPL